jgi:HEAT repeat protein
VALFGPPNVERMVAHQDARGLIRALDYDRDAEVRRQAAEALGLLGDEQALAPLVFCLNDEDLDVRKAAARALGQIGDPRAVDALTALVGQEPEDLAAVAVEALGDIGDAEATPTLIAALVDEDPTLREVSSQALAKIGAGAAFALLKKLDETEGEIHEAVRQTLRRMGPEAVNELALQVGDRRNLERSKAALALGEIGTPQAIEALVKALNSTDLHVLPAVMKALATIGEPSVDALIEALESESTLLVRSTIDALGRIGSPRAAEPLRKVAATRNAVLRDLALQALARIPDEAAIEPLIEQLKADAWTVRRQAAVALGRANAELAIPALIGVLSDPEPPVRRAAAASLDLHGWNPDDETDPTNAAGYWVAMRYWDKAVACGEAAVQPLLASLRDSVWDERRPATMALIEIGMPAVEPLLEALEDEDSGVRHSAAFALGRIYQAATAEPEGEAVEAAEQELAEQEPSTEPAESQEPAEGELPEETTTEEQESLVEMVPAERLIEPLKEALADADESVRSAAARSLGLLGAVEVVPLLVQQLQDTPVARVGAADALGRLGEAAVPALAQVLEDENADARTSAAEALGSSNSVNAVEPLIGALSDDAEPVRVAAARGLVRLGELAVPKLVEHLASDDAGLQIAMSAILGQIGNQAAVPALYALLGSENETVRLTAGAALHSLWVASREQAEPLNGVSSLFVMTCSPTPEDEDLQRWLISESFADLATDRPDITEVHTLMMVDQSRLHESYEPLPEEGYAFEAIVERFRTWVGEQGVDLEEWEQRFFHREIMTEESSDAHIVCLYYAL